ncbi:hypothetical protein QTP88_004541 [Uroleucon formosanum]
MDKLTQNITSWVEESEDLDCLYDTDDSADDPDFVQPDIQEQYDPFDPPTTENIATNSHQNVAENDSMENKNTAFKPPPPIFVKGVEDFPALCTVLIELIGVDNFICKSSTNSLKIQTTDPNAYRTLVQ